MSSPVHHPDDLDAALRYAPPWARKADSLGAASPGDPAAESPPISSDEYEDEYEPSFDGDRAMLALQHQLALDPDEMPEPPVRIDGRPPLERIALRLCAVAGIAALVAWLTISLPVDISLPIKFSQPIKPHIEEIVHAAVAPSLTATPVKLIHIHTATAPLPVVPAAIPAPVAEAAPIATQETSAAVPTAPTGVTVQTAEASPTQETSAAPTATPEPAEAVPPADPPQPAAKPLIKPPTLSADEIAVLVKRGKDFLTNGDISSARLLLRRAAEAGNAEAALALGSTFDPVIIARLGAIGVKADAAKARQWYEKAAALGSNTASQQIAKLAEASR